LVHVTKPMTDCASTPAESRDWKDPSRSPASMTARKVVKNRSPAAEISGIESS